MHVTAVKPVVLPNRPATHEPVHVAVVSPAALPYLPAGHAVHVDDAAREYLPTGHTVAFALVEPAGQAYPAVQLPLQLALVRLVALPKCPAEQFPEHIAVVNAGVEP